MINLKITLGYIIIKERDDYNRESGQAASCMVVTDLGPPAYTCLL